MPLHVTVHHSFTLSASALTGQRHRLRSDHCRGLDQTCPHDSADRAASEAARLWPSDSQTPYPRSRHGYANYLTGRGGNSVVLLAIKSNLIVGVDAGEMKYDGSVEAAANDAVNA
jgi:hypothetical protein